MNLPGGEDRIIWGTDSIWGGSPQSQIERFRRFQISTDCHISPIYFFSFVFVSELKRGVLVEYKTAGKIFLRFADQLHQATPRFEFDNSRNNIKEKPRNE